MRGARRPGAVARADGSVAATGLEVLLPAPDGRITHDYRFIGA
ncbi:hypothetical protein ACWT_5463 [Actinoplanes sp. SE50]|nr:MULTISPECIES: hypothetical protein [unclassified Actinoplanes]AEV86480.1 hypothetical protein ACPL_5593 [Actinoplanes sp. SE50/110]ATO84878.1 hypothetical protein ACWT_5463 [Actinoplanes sp. SE50]SLM02287.1 hypothetical protein ACSP50_5526 [Actinoplanes sp. SE50/110]